jgi:hypothetical protein
VAASAPGTAPYFGAGLDAEEERLTLKDVNIVNLEPQAAANAMIAGTANLDAAMTYEPYLSAVRAKPEAGKIIATTLDYPMVMDTFGCTPKFLADNPKAAQGLANAYFDALEMIKAEPKKSFEIMGADVKQSGEAFEKSQAEVPALAGPRGQPEVLRRRARAVQQGSGRPAAGGRHHPRQMPDLTRRASSKLADTALHQVGGRPQAVRMKPLVRSRRARASCSACPSSCFLFVAVWAAATFGGLVPKIFLADPLQMLRSGWTLLTEMGFAHDIGMTVWRVVGGFVIAAALALPLGVLMGAYKPVEAFFEPFVSFARYLPASAFIPLLILWAGIGEAQKLRSSSSAASSSWC